MASSTVSSTNTALTAAGVSLVLSSANCGQRQCQSFFQICRPSAVCYASNALSSINIHTNHTKRVITQRLGNSCAVDIGVGVKFVPEWSHRSYSPIPPSLTRREQDLLTTFAKGCSQWIQFT